MRLRQLTERVSSIIYHSTGIGTLLNILEQDRFRLTPDFGTSAERDRRQRGRGYYMSTSRSPINDYHYTRSGGNCLIVLDGDLINRHGYIGGPIDYWGGIHNDEMEDRIYHAKPHIPHATEYITAVHAMPNMQYPERTARNISELRKCYILLKKAGIPLYVYTDPDAYRLLDTRRSVPLSSIPYDPAARTGEYRGPSYRTRPFADYTELLSNAPDHSLSKSALKLLSRIQWDTFDEQTGLLSASIHNARSGRDRPALDRFLQLAKRLGLNSPREIIDRIRNSRVRD